MNPKGAIGTYENEEHPNRRAGAVVGDFCVVGLRQGYRYSGGSAADLTAFYLPANLARIFIVALVIFELAVVLLLWKRPTLLLLIAPAAFAFVLVYSALKGVDCGCFGALPF